MEAEQREEQQQAPEESPPQAQGGDEGAEQPEQQQAGSQEADAEAFVNEGEPAYSLRPAPRWQAQRRQRHGAQHACRAAFCAPPLAQARRAAP